jgi:hypothetical protein
MSEPTIKPVGRLCLECGQTGDHFYSCSHHMADDEETSRVNVYTHDDLVAVALATFEWAGFKVDPEGAEGKAASAIVERLTGVKR